MKRSLKNIISDGMKLFIKDIKSTKWVIIAIITYFVFSRKVLAGFCPVVKILGIPCPSCGFTRAGLKLLSFDFKGAWEIHPFIYGVALLAVLFVWERYVRLNENPRWILWFSYAMIVALVAFYIYRMYRYFPGEPPMSYYEDNLVNRIRELLRGI